MNAKDFFLERYRGFQEYPEVLLQGFTDEQLRRGAAPGLNPVAWIVWHTARSEDLGVSRLVCDLDQLLDDGWAERLGVDERLMGTGMTEGAVQALSDRIDLDAMKAYRTAVARRTEGLIGELEDTVWSERLDAEHLRQVMVDEGGGGRRADLLVGLYNLQTKGWLVGHLALTHNYYHMGQVAAQRGMRELPNPW